MSLGSQVAVATLLFLTAGCGAWRRQPTGTVEILHSIWGSGKTDIYAVGDSGTILHTTDGGEAWALLPTPTGSRLCAVWGSGPDDVYVGGDGGIVLHSLDRGAHWAEGGDEAMFRVNGLWGFGHEVYAAAATGVFCSTDEGATWERRSSLVFEAIEGLPDGSLVACGWELAHSADGGRTWGKTEPLGGGVLDVAAVGSRTVFAAMASRVGVSADGGATWKVSGALTRSGGGALFVPPTWDQLAGVWAYSEQVAFAVGENGAVVATRDGGETWDLLPSSTNHTLTAVWGCGPDAVWAVGTGGVILTSR